MTAGGLLLRWCGEKPQGLATLGQQSMPTPRKKQPRGCSTDDKPSLQTWVAPLIAAISSKKKPRLRKQ
jgi:hypothetical protein